MRLPLRRSQRDKNYDEQDAPVFLTSAGLKRLEDELTRLQAERPSVVDDLSRAIQMGDLSENAEYMDAKHKLGRIDSRIFSIKERLKRVQLIEEGTDPSGHIRIGSSVIVESNEKLKTYQIVGPHESSPSRGRISYVSPLGSTLLGKMRGDVVEIETEGGKTVYKIMEVT